MERLKKGILNGYPNFINNFKYMMRLDSSEVAKIIWFQIIYSIPASLIVSFLFTAIAVATETKMTFQVILAGFLLSPILLEMAVDRFKEKNND